MIRTPLLLVLVMGLAGTASADAWDIELGMNHARDSLIASWGTNRETDSWRVSDSAGDGISPPGCAGWLDALKDQPATLKVVFSFDAGPELPAGTHTLAEMRKGCEHVARLARVLAVEKWAEQAMNDSPKLDGPNFELVFYSGCIKVYDDMIKAGMSPNEQVPERNLEDPKTHGKLVWKGTIESIKKTWCDPGFAKAQEKIAKREAPYRAVLKNDKLEMALTDAYFYMPGGKGTDKPKDLAASNVWFRDATPDSGCVNGTPHVLSRYQFDGTGKLVKTTSKTYCGSVPGSAFR